MPLTRQSVNQKLEQQLATVSNESEQQLLRDISNEEHTELLQKMITATKVGRMSEQDRLYIEQELTDWLGFDVLSELEGKQLPHMIAKMKSAQHLKRHPTDELSDHLAVHEAGLSIHRSYFGWFTDGGHLYPEQLHQEQFFVGLPLQYLKDWTGAHQQFVEWYKYRKVVVINPANRMAVVACVGTIGPHHTAQYQAEGSPELIKTGRVWSPEAEGKVLLFFIQDPDNSVPYGPIKL